MTESAKPDEVEARLVSAAARRLVRLLMDAGGIADEETGAVLMLALAPHQAKDPTQ